MNWKRNPYQMFNNSVVEADRWFEQASKSDLKQFANEYFKRYPGLEAFEIDDSICMKVQKWTSTSF